MVVGGGCGGGRWMWWWGVDVVVAGGCGGGRWMWWWEVVVAVGSLCEQMLVLRTLENWKGENYFWKSWKVMVEEVAW